MSSTTPPPNADSAKGNKGGACEPKFTPGMTTYIPKPSQPRSLEEFCTKNNDQCGSAPSPVLQVEAPCTIAFTPSPTHPACNTKKSSCIKKAESQSGCKKYNFLKLLQPCRTKMKQKCCCPYGELEPLCSWFASPKYFHRCSEKECCKGTCLFSNENKLCICDNSVPPSKSGHDLGSKISTNTLHGIRSVNDLRSWSACCEDQRRYFLEQMLQVGEPKERVVVEKDVPHPQDASPQQIQYERLLTQKDDELERLKRKLAELERQERPKNISDSKSPPTPPSSRTVSEGPPPSLPRKKSDPPPPTPSRKNSDIIPVSRKNSEPPPPSSKNSEPPPVSRKNSEPPPPSRKNSEPPPVSRKNSEPPPPSRKNSEPPLVSRKNSEPPPPSRKNSEPPTPSRKNSEPPTPSRRESEPLPPSRKESEPIPSSRIESEAPLRKESDLPPKSRKESLRKISDLHTDIEDSLFSEPEDEEEEIQEDIPEEIPEAIPEDIPEAIPEDIPEAIPEYIPPPQREVEQATPPPKPVKQAAQPKPVEQAAPPSKPVEHIAAVAVPPSPSVAPQPPLPSWSTPAPVKKKEFVCSRCDPSPPCARGSQFQVEDNSSTRDFEAVAADYDIENPYNTKVKVEGNKIKKMRGCEVVEEMDPEQLVAELEWLRESMMANGQRVHELEDALYNGGECDMEDNYTADQLRSQVTLLRRRLACVEAQLFKKEETENNLNGSLNDYEQELDEYKTEIDRLQGELGDAEGTIQLLRRRILELDGGQGCGDMCNSCERMSQMQGESPYNHSYNLNDNVY